MHSGKRTYWFSGFLGLVFLVGAVWLYRWWQRPPVVEFDNLKYIQLLRTAVSSRREDYVNGVQRAVRLRREEGAMSDAEAGHFDSILAMVRMGDWESAERMAFDFEVAQSNRRRTRTRTNDPHNGHVHDVERPAEEELAKRSIDG